MALIPDVNEEVWTWEYIQQFCRSRLAETFRPFELYSGSIAAFMTVIAEGQVLRRSLLGDRPSIAIVEMFVFHGEHVHSNAKEEGVRLWR